ncbi:CotJC protein [Clostridium sartagoforme AAU1]|uniref:CotJC protein n=1 Tax=Clostridium sartagoforme AAU1 TaxID=1202534 RepID=R9CD98_9CLOT|nr:ferritin-like domain-containing protein [Clostridium sartagoforme]EOR27267.1 CotJC protein [Clostridium sartagoforme AAU1]
MKGDYKDLQDSYSLGLPYPKIKVYDKNSIYADLIKKSYAGEVSELTAITQYTYHQLITSDYIKNTLKGIAIVEMHHLEILGELLIALGENPTFLLRKKIKTFIGVRNL